jgi:small subunit ribosomal protein S4
MHKRLYFKVKTCRKAQSFLWNKNRLTQNHKKNIVQYLELQRKKGGQKKNSEYLNQLKTKQKITFLYGNLTKKALKSLASRCTKQRNILSSELLGLLERRLDACLFRMHIFPTIPAARQWIHHGFVFVNGKKLTIASKLLYPGDLITLKKPFSQSLRLALAKEGLKRNVQHLEINYKLCAAIFLFPPQQIHYPSNLEL